MCHSLAAMDERRFASPILFVHPLGVPGYGALLGKFLVSRRRGIEQVLAFGSVSLADDPHRAMRQREAAGTHAFPRRPRGSRTLKRPPQSLVDLFMVVFGSISRKTRLFIVLPCKRALLSCKVSVLTCKLLTAVMQSHTLHVKR